MLIYELYCCCFTCSDGEPFTLGSTNFCKALRYAADELTKVPDFQAIEWWAFDPLAPKNDSDPACRIPFWSAEEGLLRPQWPEWFREAFDDHCEGCDLFHRFPSRDPKANPPRFN